MKTFSSAALLGTYTNTRGAHVKKKTCKTKLHRTVVEENISKMENTSPGRDAVVSSFPTWSAAYLKQTNKQTNTYFKSVLDLFSYVLSSSCLSWNTEKLFRVIKTVEEQTCLATHVYIIHYSTQHIAFSAEYTLSTDHVRNEDVLPAVKEQRNILHEIHKRKANWIGHILRRNCRLQRVTEGKIQGGIEVTGRQGRRRRKLLDDLKERRGYSHLKGEALDRTMWRARFGRGFGPVVRQTTKWINTLSTTIVILTL